MAKVPWEHREILTSGEGERKLNTEGSPLPSFHTGPVLALLVWRRVGFSHFQMADLGMYLTGDLTQFPLTTGSWELTNVGSPDVPGGEESLNLMKILEQLGKLPAGK